MTELRHKSIEHLSDLLGRTIDVFCWLDCLSKLCLILVDLVTQKVSQSARYDK